MDFNDKIILDEDVSWEGRVWIDIDQSKTINNNKTIKFLTYNVFASYKCIKISYSTIRQWSYRKLRLIREISVYNADIICLQDVDHFQDFWCPELMKLGYDSVFHRRTNLFDNHYEGVVIGFRRSIFKLYRSIFVEFNKVSEYYIERGRTFQDKLLNDDVGLITLLQTYDRQDLPPFVCIGSAMLCDKLDGNDIRYVQSEYFTRQIELANKEHLAPVLIGISMNDTPTSSSYHLFRTGRKPIRGDIPKQCTAPIAKFFSRSSVKLYWKQPTMTAADSPVLTYKIAYRPGGSSVLGFGQVISAPFNECVQYEEIHDIDGDIRYVAKDQLMFTISDLSPEIPYEFKVLAVNSMGEGIWSEPSQPIVLRNAFKAPKMPELENFHNLFKVYELREQSLMHDNDWNANQSVESTIMESFTDLTPRNYNGNIDIRLTKIKLLPDEINSRVGLPDELIVNDVKSINDLLNKDVYVRRSLIRDRLGYYESVSDSKDGRFAVYNKVENNIDNKIDSTIDSSNDQLVTQLPKLDVMPTNFRPVDSNINPLSPRSDDEVDSPTEIKKTTNNFLYRRTKYLKSMNITINNPKMIVTSLSSIASDSIGDTMDDDESNDTYINRYINQLPYMKFICHMTNDHIETTIMDCVDVINTHGRSNNRQIHHLNLRSVYESYSSAGEPVYTTSQPGIDNHNLTCCYDYIFYNKNCFQVKRLLTIPVLVDLIGHNPNESLTIVDTQWINCNKNATELFNKHDILIHNNHKVRNYSVDLIDNAIDSKNNKSESNRHKNEINILSKYDSKNRRISQYKYDIPTSYINSIENQLIVKFNKMYNYHTIFPDVSLYKPITYVSSYNSEYNLKLQKIHKLKNNIKNLIINKNQYVGPITPILDSNDELMKQNAILQESLLRQHKGYNNNNNTYQCEINSFWGGKWSAPYPNRNINRNHLWLPNDSYCSSHIALCVELYISQN